ncbi:hypothetical protein F0562_007435 [Nyssa sinensis]|uniref:AAA+ ATPase domain-containing protein n=1 Tax=Nyssa sinensis TaxID=561372 RepID=A0A5J5A538_9ASTE|nr:hypothetical protein F0562_007435 [Nyssa sinensis]
MAESAVTFLLNKIAALQREEIKLMTGFWGDVRYIKDELERMRAFLREADAKEESDQEIKVWVKQVRDVVYDTEDVLDESTLHLEGSSSTITSSTWHERRGDALLLEEAELVGIDKHKTKLIGFLVDNEHSLKVISVVGMGGMGKTTLVKKVYDDANVRKHFQTHVWITVSQSFIIEELLKNIIEQLYGGIKQRVHKRISSMDNTGLKMEINKFLHQTRYLLVLDDVWSTLAWEALKCAFPNNNCGSRIMLTTRIVDTASTSCTNFHGNEYHMDPLSRKESWTLFCKKTFRVDYCPPHLKELCRGILKRCEGLPLAIVAISGLLSTKDTRRVDEWEIIHPSLGAELEGNDKLGSMKKILSLSYNDLPYYLKACFLYFSIFPEDDQIKCKRLIRLWIAEGFVEGKAGQTPEEVAEGYLEELVNRSLIQIARRTRNGRVSTCRTDDLLREIILSKSREQNFATVANKNNTRLLEKIRRLSIHERLRNIQQSKSISQVRSLFLFRVADSQDESPVAALFSGGLKLLRVLDLEGAPLEIFPSEVVNLFNLRYLSLRGTKVKKIPSSIRRLQHLETLDLKHTYVTELPVEILKLQQPRHLLVYRYQKRSSSPFHSTYGFKAPPGMGCLTSLQKLCFVEAIQGSDILRELGRLTQLRRLGITKLRREDGMELCSSIQKLGVLRSLDINSINDDEIIDIQCMSAPPQYLQRLWLQGCLEMLPPWILSLHSLVKLRLRWSQLGYDPLESLQALPNLSELQLRQAYSGDELHFNAGGFQGLKVLHLHDLKGLRRVIVEDKAMPSLEELRIIGCELLEAMPSGIEFLTKLKSMAFADMDNELIRKLQSKQGDDYSKIMNIPEVYYTYSERGRWKQIYL